MRAAVRGRYPCARVPPPTATARASLAAAAALPSRRACSAEEYPTRHSSCVAVDGTRVTLAAPLRATWPCGAAACDVVGATVCRLWRQARRSSLVLPRSAPPADAVAALPLPLSVYPCCLFPERAQPSLPRVSHAPSRPYIGLAVAVPRCGRCDPHPAGGVGRRSQPRLWVSEDCLDRCLQVPI